MTPDQTPLDERQCLELLGRTAVGRVVYTVGALPAVLPVRYRLGGDGSVLLRADGASELVRAVAGALVAFEAGELSETDGSGWSVTVLGRADVTPDPTCPLGPAAPAPSAPATPAGQVSVRILPELVTGRALAGPPAGTC
ncbi:pyridoxamine 5'-phosphate oxidase family protein [Kitasatospora sp. NPDC088346]|uniref:pyridoxamine 5'-phosphate oxidase family protein n=1 Tax=Kitasatospora sp. NPDC088346 TaxID=3364073 RepID=UPI00380FDC25